MSPGLSFTTSPTLNPEEYTSIRSALCFALATAENNFLISSVLKIPGMVLSFLVRSVEYRMIFYLKIQVYILICIINICVSGWMNAKYC